MKNLLLFFIISFFSLFCLKAQVADKTTYLSDIKQELQKTWPENPYSVVNCITTAIGGENSEQGCARFNGEVLVHRPDVVLIDYALNDRGMGLEKGHRVVCDMIAQWLLEP